MARGKTCGLGPIFVADEEDERGARRLKRRRIIAQGLSFFDNSSRKIASATGLAQFGRCDETRAEKSIDLERRNFVLIDDDDDDDEEVCGAQPMEVSDGSVVYDAEYVAFLDSLAFGRCGDSDAYYDYSMGIDGGIVDTSVVTGSAADGNAANRDAIEENVDADGLVGGVPVNGGTTNVSADDGFVSIEIVDYCTSNTKSMDGGVFDAAHVDVANNVGPATVSHGGCDVRCVDGGSDANIDDLNFRPKDDCIVNESFEDGCVGVNDGNLNAGSADDGGGGGENDDGFSDVDPSYKMFMDNLRVDGKAYVAELPVGDGISVLIKYETDDEPYAACRLVNLETVKDCPKREEIERGKVLRRALRKRSETQSDSRTENDGTSKKTKDIPVAKKSSVMESQLEKELCDPSACRANGHANKKPRLEAISGSRRTRVDIQSDSIRERIEIGANLRNVRAIERNNSAVVSFRANWHTGRCSSLGVLCQSNCNIRNDAKPHLLDKDYQVFLNSLKIVGGNQEFMPKKGTGSRRDRKKTQSNSQRKSMEPRTKSRGVRAKERKIAVVEREVKTKAADPVSFRATGGTSEKPSLEALGSTNCKHKCAPKLDILNKSYQDINKSLNKDRRPGIIKSESGTEVTCKSDDSRSSDLEVLESGTDPFCGEYNSPFVTSKVFASLIHNVDGVECKESCSDGKSALFRKRLVEVIQRPYDENECKELYKKVCCRKPVERERHLRSSTKQYVSESLGKSYLDHHSDFAKEIHSAIESPLKLLSLLRGFFYWLQNLTQEGQFKPWSDSQCLQLLPLCS